MFRHNVLNKQELPDTEENFRTDVREVWFAGTHSGAFWTLGLPGYPSTVCMQMSAEAICRTLHNMILRIFNFDG
jgi:hypothetical protein